MSAIPPTAVLSDGKYDGDTLGRDVLAPIAAPGERGAIVVGHDWGAVAASSASRPPCSTRRALLGAVLLALAGCSASGALELDLSADSCPVSGVSSVRVTLTNRGATSVMATPLPQAPVRISADQGQTVNLTFDPGRDGDVTIVVEVLGPDGALLASSASVSAQLVPGALRTVPVALRVMPREVVPIFVRDHVTHIGGALYQVTTDENHIYWADLWGNYHIKRANLDGSGIEEEFIDAQGGPLGVAVSSSHIYWSRFYEGTIGIADLDGSHVNNAFINPAFGQISGLTIHGSHLYWGNFNIGGIGRANLDGSDVVRSFVDGAPGVEFPVVDDAHIYWSNDLTGRIGRANLDGSEPNADFIVAVAPWGLALDGAHLYWVDFREGTLGRSDLDGKNLCSPFIRGLNQPEGLTFDGARLLWTDQGDNTIGAAIL